MPTWESSIYSSPNIHSPKKRLDPRYWSLYPIFSKRGWPKILHQTDDTGGTLRLFIFTWWFLPLYSLPNKTPRVFAECGNGWYETLNQNNLMPTHNLLNTLMVVRTTTINQVIRWWHMDPCFSYSFGVFTWWTICWYVATPQVIPNSFEHPIILFWLLYYWVCDPSRPGNDFPSI